MNDNLIRDCRQTVIIDAWPEPRLRDFYLHVRETLLAQPQDAEWLWASYETGDLDSCFLDLIRDPRARLVTPMMTKSEPDACQLAHVVQVMGRSWQRCVHGRPLGIKALLRNHHDVIIDTDMITVWNSVANTDSLRLTAADVMGDALPWQQLGPTQWHVHRSMIDDVNWQY